MDLLKSVIKPTKTIRTTQPVSKHFSIRDPIHEWITCSPEEKLVINSPLMQRLKWVMQLSMVNQVFNGGTHSRFSHSLGAMKVAGEYMEHLFTNSSLGDLITTDPPDHWISLARMAGLLHDIGHGPFSHSFDRVVYSRIYNIEDGGHDLARLHLVKSNLLEPLINKCGVNSDELIEVWEPGATGKPIGRNLRAMYDIIRAVVEGPFGADRIDFVRRDSYYTGTQHLGTIAYHRIIDNSAIVFPDDGSMPCLSYNRKCIGDMIRALDGRLNLYRDVYFHKSAMAATLLIEEIMDLICEPLDLEETVTDPNAFQFLNDTTLLAEVMHKRVDLGASTSNVSEMSRWEIDLASARLLCNKLMLRQLPKMQYEECVTDLKTPYNPKFYADRWYRSVPSNKYRIMRTRIVSGISSKKFAKYKIVFHDSQGILSNCDEVLREYGYTAPQKPYYLVRGYSMPVTK